MLIYHASHGRIGFALLSLSFTYYAYFRYDEIYVGFMRCAA